MSATWRVVETNELGIRVGKGIAEIASLVSALAEDAYRGLAAYRARRRARWLLAQLGNHLLQDIGIDGSNGRHQAGILDGIAEGLTQLVAPDDRP